MPKEKSHEEDNKTNKQLLKYGEDLAKLYASEKEKRKDLLIANQKLSTIYNSSPNGLIVLNNEFLIIQANETFEKIILKTPQEFLSKHITEILPSQSLKEYIRLLQIGEGIQGQEFEIKHSAKFFEIKILQIKTKNDLNWLMVIRDIGLQKAIENQKNAFISIASHELRTPLGHILGFTEILSSDFSNQLDSQGQEILERISKANLRMVDIVEKLMKFAEIDQNNFFSNSFEEFDLSKVITHVVSILEHLAEQNNVSIHMVGNNSSYLMYSRADLINTAIHQLIQNAILFNSVGGKVEIQVQEGERDIQIDIRDTGVGIHEENFEKIFDPFIQIDDHMTRRVGGLGLGLGIARQAIRQLGGEILLKNNEKMKGSTFSMKMPRKSVPANEEILILNTKLESSTQQSLEYARDINIIYKKLQENFTSTLKAIINTIEAKDSYTRGHTERVGAFSLKTAEAMGFSTRELEDLNIATQIHDIGKIGVPDLVLNKPGKLTEQEYDIIKSHVNIGWEIIRPLKFLEEIAPVAFAHHEHMDGNGYPKNLVGKDIPLGGRIMAIADAYDAMTSDRPYRKGMSTSKALAIISKGKNTQWDAKIVDVFLSIYE